LSRKAEQHTPLEEHRAQLPHCPVLTPADGRSRRGPGATTNWLLPGRLLCGAKPAPSGSEPFVNCCGGSPSGRAADGDHETLSMVTHFVDLTGGNRRFREEAATRAKTAGRAPPQFIVHTIPEFQTGGDEIVVSERLPVRYIYTVRR